jgi:hypothetical protein
MRHSTHLLRSKIKVRIGQFFVSDAAASIKELETMRAMMIMMTMVK